MTVLRNVILIISVMMFLPLIINAYATTVYPPVTVPVRGHGIIISQKNIIGGAISDLTTTIFFGFTLDDPPKCVFAKVSVNGSGVIYREFVVHNTTHYFTPSWNYYINNKLVGVWAPSLIPRGDIAFMVIDPLTGTIEESVDISGLGAVTPFVHYYGGERIVELLQTTLNSSALLYMGDEWFNISITVNYDKQVVSMLSLVATHLTPDGLGVTLLGEFINGTWFRAVYFPSQGVFLTEAEITGEPIYVTNNKVVYFDNRLNRFYIITLDNVTVLEAVDISLRKYRVFSNGTFVGFDISPTSTGTYLYKFTMDLNTETASLTKMKLYLPKKYEEGETPGDGGWKSIPTEPNRLRVVNANITFYDPESNEVVIGYSKIVRIDEALIIRRLYQMKPSNIINVFVSPAKTTLPRKDVAAEVLTTDLPTNYTIASPAVAISYRGYRSGTPAIELTPYIQVVSPTSGTGPIGHIKGISNVIPSGVGTIAPPPSADDGFVSMVHEVVTADSTGYWNLSSIPISVATVKDKLVIATEPGITITGFDIKPGGVVVHLASKGYVMLTATANTISKIVVFDGVTNTTICSGVEACEGMYDSDGVIVIDPATMYIEFADQGGGAESVALGGRANKNIADTPELVIVVAIALFVVLAVLWYRRATLR